jgi:hypothetical protein
MEGRKEGGRERRRELFSISYTHMERDIRWTYHVTTEKGIQGIKMDRNILHTLKRKKANWIGHILGRN